MKIYTTQILLSMSLASVTLSAPSVVQTPVAAGRNKRSFFTDHGQRQFSRQHMNKVLRKTKIEAKRGAFDTLDLDMLLNDPLFMELAAEQENQMDMNNFDNPAFPVLPNNFEPAFENGLESGLHNAIGPGLHNGVESGLHKTIASDLQNGLESELHNGFGSSLHQGGLENGISNRLQNGLPNHVMRPPKDQMSNVIPGAHGPFDSAPSRRMQNIADSMMDEFMEFLTLKEMGLLDSCLGVKRR